MSLQEFILSEQNIYNAIYALRSYVFEKGLLKADDIEMFHRLSDKYDFIYIKDVITKCKEILAKKLQSKELFDVEVYFKIKKYDPTQERFVFRPIHTASLIDQICMVCMLMPLMFNDTNDKRQLSELSKLIPHNFFGNLPSTNIDEIFIHWQQNYKIYSEHIVSKSQECKEKQLYKKEVCLDLKDFFPSINPAFIFHLVSDKMRLVYSDDDFETLEVVLTKLLYFRIKKDNLEGWEHDYCSNGNNRVDSYYFTNRGIAQGLPQGYFFGNLMMLKVAGLVEKVFPGESFYYVDDSVVFTDAVTDKDEFISKINSLNTYLQEIEFKTVSNKQLAALKHLDPKDREAQQHILYGIEYHVQDKSFFVDVEDSYSGRGGMQYLTRQVSKAAMFSNNIDDVDDTISKEKLEALLEVINSELKKEKDRLKQNETMDDSQLKLLKRYKKYFLYRLRLLTIREEGFVTSSYIEDFIKRFQIESKEIDCAALQELFDEEIFQAESRMIINRSELSFIDYFKGIVTDFEARLAERAVDTIHYLYYNKDLNGTSLFSNHENIEYHSLSRIFRQLYGVYSTSTPQKQKMEIDKFLLDWQKQTRPGYLPEYTFFVMSNSEEFVRKAYNAFFSILYCVDATDHHNFSRNNNRCLNYAELRILVFLRNYHFTKKEFERFVNDINQDTSIKEHTKIDMALMEVLHVLVTTVKNPLFVDNIILIHRLVSGLWKNGSKFLNAYTLHNEDHAITLIYQCMRILKVIDYIGIKQNDYYVLFLACYLHDISMVIHPNINDFKLGDIESEKIVSKNMVKFKKLKSYNIQSYHEQFRNLLVDVFSDVYSYFENEKRSKHPKESAVYIKNQHNLFLNYIDNAILEYVSLISESHGYDAVDVYGRKSKAKDDLFSVKYMMMLIRLADLMDMANDRVNYYRLRQNLSSLSVMSQFHWISHLITDRAYITASYNVDTKKRLIEQPITETIKIKILLNVEYSASFAKTNACKGCQAEHGLKSRHPDEEEYNMTVVKVKNRSTNCSCVKTAGCPIICGWMMKKNYWLLNELLELKSYLNQANTRLFNTEMEIDFLYKDVGLLDSDMFDTVREYLEKT